MKKEEFKKLIKESVKEVLIEEGVLSTIVSEVIKGTNAMSVMQTRVENVPVAVVREQREEALRKDKERLQETKKKMLDAIGDSSYNGVDLFEGTKPIRKSGQAGDSSTSHSPLSEMDPDDAGVDISSLLDKADVWKRLAE
jgi:hypothetical protein